MDTAAKTPKPPLIRDDLAYMLPMASFLVLIWAGGLAERHGLYPAAYTARALIVGGMLIAFRKSYTAIRWNHWWLGILVGVAGIFQWVPMQLFLEKHFAMFRADPATVFNPELFFPSEAQRWAFYAVRIVGAVVVVPVMEELFWRDFGWRTVIAPNDFKLAGVGEWDWKAFVVIPLVFAMVHANWWATSVVWAFMIGGLLAVTRSLGACIIAHATTNLLLAAWVLYSRRWDFW